MPGSEPTGTDRPDPAPREVAGYRLLRRIGEGGMSTVFLSYDVPADRPVAVKVLADHLAHSREFVNRFYREARLSRLVSHPNLVQGHAAGFDPLAGQHYIILEFVDGPTVHAALVAHGPLPVGVAVQVGLDIARALAFLHARQYVHRDVKPDNILLHPSGVAKLGDMGLAKRLNDDQQLTSASQGVGTSYYMAYEQALNANLVDGRSDVFALGATLYHLLTGEVPFPGASHEEVVRGKEHEAFRPVRELNPAVPPALAEILEATLARDPRARFQTAADLADALAATGLATPIPPYGPAGGEGRPAGGDAPTRADLRTPDETPPAPPGPAAPPVGRPFAPVPARPAVAPPTNLRPHSGAILGAVAVLGLLGAAVAGVLATRSGAGSQPTGPAAGIPDPFPQIPSTGLPPTRPQ